MNWNENYTTLNYLLADLYDEKEDSKRIVVASGLNKGLIAFKNQAYTNWFNILTEAIKQDKITDLIQVVLRPEERGKNVTVRETLSEIVKNIESDIVPIVVEDTEGLPAHSPEEKQGFEKLMGLQSTLLPINFLEKGLKCAKAVAKICLPNGVGTGFLLRNNWLITNHHVIPDAQAAQKAIIQFNLQKTVEGYDAIVEEFKIDIAEDTFFTDGPLDYSIVKIAGDPVSRFGFLELSERLAQKDDFVNIIQHPAGGPKQIALYHNTVISVDNKYVLYLTDTLRGSSGSPVFNSDWEVVALHHWGGRTRDQLTNMSVFSNRGINILNIRDAIMKYNIYDHGNGGR